jgi:hypothetical protein
MEKILEVNKEDEEEIMELKNKISELTLQLKKQSDTKL